MTTSSLLSKTASNATALMGAARSSGSVHSASLSSSTLLQGQKCVAIEHQGHIYRLQVTKQGKLILTK